METNPAIFAYRKMPKKQNINNTDVNMRVMSYFQKFRTMKEDIVNGRNSKKK